MYSFESACGSDGIVLHEAESTDDYECKLREFLKILHFSNVLTYNHILFIKI